MTMRTRTWGVWLPALVGLVACSSGGIAAHSDAGVSGGPASQPPGTPGTSWGPGATSSSQLSVVLQNTGRHGDTLLLSVQGSDPAAQTTEAHVQLLDASGAPVVAFDTDSDGAADSAESRVHFDQSTLGQKSFTTTITLPGLFALHPKIASAVVSLSDVNGTLSPAVTAELLAQKVAAVGDACDTTSVSNRCDEGLGCSGKPATCQSTTAPTLTTVAYFGGGAPVQLFQGSDPAENLASITVNFLDGNGQSLSIDMSGDNDFASSVVLDTRSAAGQSFFYESDPTARFVALVPKISAVPADSMGRAGPSVVATLAPQPVRMNGQSCDSQGFTTCAAGLVCSPGIAGGTNSCGGVARLQSDKCKAAAPTTAGVLAGWGHVQGASLWDPPAGCASPSVVGRPEGVVALKLDHAVSTLTVSTATPETDFDTILYVLPGCASTSADALGCNDDVGPGFASTVKMNNVAAGIYLVVVDSGNDFGGHFGLTVTAQ